MREQLRVLVEEFHDVNPRLAFWSAMHIFVKNKLGINL